MFRFGTPHCLAVVAVAALSSPACQCGRLEIGASNLVAEGRFQGLWGHPWADRQKYVMTERISSDGGPNPLTVVRIEEQKACDIQVPQPIWYFAMKDSLMAFDGIDWNRWVGRLVEVVLPCGPVRPVLDNAYLALWRSPDETTFYALADVTEGRVGRLVRVEWPSAVTTDVRAGQTTDSFDFDWPDRRYFYRENGQLVATTLEGQEEGRVGSGVTGFTSSGRGEVFFTRDREVFLAKVDGSRTMKLSDNACGAAFVEEHITYLEPCYDAPAQIVVADRETGAPLGRFGANVNRYRAGPTTWLSWMEGQQTRDGPGSLWVKEPRGEPLLIAEGVEPNWHVLDEARVVLHARRTTDRRAQLLAFQIASGETLTLAENTDIGLPISESPWSAHWAVVEGVEAMPLPDGGVSTDRAGALVGVHPVSRERIPVADGVPVRGFRFSWQAPALGYLWRFDAATRTGDFEVFSMIDRKKYPVDTGVRAFEEVFAPKRGVAYIVDIEGHRGVYFVEADIHLF